MGRNYLGFLLGLWLMAASALAAELQVGDLALDYTVPWERATAQEEEAENSAILRWRGPGPGLMIFLPRHQVGLKVEEARFHRQLEQSWRALYGADARIYPVRIADTTWRVCRRPSLNGDATVFQLVKVHQGRAHHILVIAQGRMETLPDAAERLAASARWGAVRSLVLTGEDRQGPLPDYQLPQPAGSAVPAGQVPPAAAAEAGAVAAAPAVAPSPQPASAPAEAAVPSPEPPPGQGPAIAVPAKTGLVAGPAAAGPVVPQVAPAEPRALGVAPGPRWRLARVIHVLPQGRQLTALAQAEKQRLGEDAILTGYGISLASQGVQGFLEGYAWQEAEGRAPQRRSFGRYWQLAWDAPEAIGPGRSTWRVRLSAAQPETPGEAGMRLGLRLEPVALCGAREAMLASLDALVKGDAGPLTALMAQCPPQEPPLAASALLDSGEGSGREVSLDLPEGWPPVSGMPKDEVRRLVVVASHPPGEAGPGQDLMSGVRSYFIYRY